MLTLLTTAVLFFGGTNPEPVPIATVPCGDGVLVIYDNDTASLATLDPVTNTVTVTTAFTDPPVLSTTYTDTAGQAHTVETPVLSSTPAAIRRAINNHKLMLAAMHAAFPPMPPAPPPPPPPAGGSGGSTPPSGGNTGCVVVFQVGDLVA